MQKSLDKVHKMAFCSSHRVDEYLKTIWVLEKEEGKSIVRVKHLSKRLEVSMASVVEMLKSLKTKKYVEYEPGEGVNLTPEGREAARKLVRNHRLMEVYMDRKIRIPIDEKMVCGFSHHMTDDFSESICSSLGHPKKCPHGFEIPACKAPKGNP